MEIKETGPNAAAEHPELCSSWGLGDFGVGGIRFGSGGEDGA